MFLPVILYPLAASCPAMYSPSELLWLQPHVFIQIFWVPGIKLQNGQSIVIFLVITVNFNVICVFAFFFFFNLNQLKKNNIWLKQIYRTSWVVSVLKKYCKHTAQLFPEDTVPKPSIIGWSGNVNLVFSWYHSSNCLTDLSAWSSSWFPSFFFLNLGMILFRADCLSCGVGSLKDTMSSMSSITESHADGMMIWQSQKNDSKNLDVAYTVSTHIQCCLYLLYI